MTELPKTKILNKDNIYKIIDEIKRSKKKIVLTSGSWDMLHVGHMRYIQKAADYGDTLIVGVDSDSKIKLRKGKDRPIVSQKERLEMLQHLKYIDYLYVKYPEDKSLSLLEIVNPDILIVSETTQHEDGKKEVMKKYCKKVVVMPAQAETSTTARIRRLHIDGMKKIYAVISKEIAKILDTEIQKI